MSWRGSQPARSARSEYPEGVGEAIIFSLGEKIGKKDRKDLLFWTEVLGGRSLYCPGCVLMNMVISQL